MPVSDTPLRKRSQEELDLLAKKLRLSEKMRKFAEAYVLDPKRNKSKAARAAGAQSPGKQGHTWANMTKVQTYVNAMLTKAQEVEEFRTGETVLQLAEAEGILSRQARGNMGQFIDVVVQGKGEDRRSFPCFNFERAQNAGCLSNIRKLKVRAGFTPEGLPWTETDLELFDPQRSMDMLFRLRGWYKDEAQAQPEAMAAIWAAFLARVPPSVLQALDEARLGGQVIDVPRLVEASEAGNRDGSGGEPSELHGGATPMTRR